MNSKKDFQIQNKHILSLACIMFFPRVVYFMIKSEDYELTQEDKNFIKGYIKFGFIILSTIALAVIIGIVSLTSNILPTFMSTISNLLAIFGVILIILGVFMIFSEKTVLQGDINLKYKKITPGNIDIAFYYIPIYNIYLWYNEPKINQYRWIKESILFRHLWALIVLITFNISIAFLLLIIGIVRLVSIIAGIDFIPDKYKEKADKIFDKNPEEVYGYIKGPIVFIVEKVKSGGKYSINSIDEYIQQSKNEYSNLKNIEYTTNKSAISDQKEIFIEYAILGIILFLLSNSIFSFIQLSIYGNIIIIAFLIILFRYIISLYLQKLPYIPIIHEVVIIGKKTINFLK
ncbi:hypothetical protein [Candidatus Absconditicoccus praedator]|uniref:hypothetical protein n=1 Tax=Candidatus Absconditicoccus praedator TaxID=2735562 RepID=UPI001E63A467|nr:hypothetical protein [Candidatus Absconditicoccus praedator]UFX83083.1 hypothetical protein HLG78_03030 [Candidatus Absconditicoccus praedator]